MLEYLYGGRFGSKIFSNPTFSRINSPTFLKFSHTSYLPAYEDGTDSVPKRRHVKFRRRGITQKKAYSIQNKAKVWYYNFYSQPVAYLFLVRVKQAMINFPIGDLFFFFNFAEIHLLMTSLASLVPMLPSLFEIQKLRRNTQVCLRAF